ncbi:MAG: alpha/beta hydrolase [Acidimicrobiia bacterium]|nr:alpha/beta hydrolase [Acidimicrobiia bacterium]
MKLPVVMLPSLGRGAADFDQLSSSLTNVGYQVIALDPPTSAPDDATLHDLAALVLGELDRRGLHRVHLVGHAFGQRLARCVLADAPERVATLTMLAAGGLVPMHPEIARALASCFDTSRTAAEHLDDVRKVFFADGNDASVWADGWLPDVAALQSAAVHRTPPGAWTNSVAERVLVVQGLQDVCAVPENGRLYVDAHREQATLVEIEGAGHALLPERPDEVAAALLTFLESSRDKTRRQDGT